MPQSLARNEPVEGLREGLGAVGLRVSPCTLSQADIAGALWMNTRRDGLSLTDRACLALALERSLPVLTTDRAWAVLELDIGIEVIR